MGRGQLKQSVLRGQELPTSCLNPQTVLSLRNSSWEILQIRSESKPRQMIMELPASLQKVWGPRVRQPAAFLSARVVSRFIEAGAGGWVEFLKAPPGVFCVNSRPQVQPKYLRARYPGFCPSLWPSGTSGFWVVARRLPSCCHTVLRADEIDNCLCGTLRFMVCYLALGALGRIVGLGVWIQCLGFRAV